MDQRRWRGTGTRAQAASLAVVLGLASLAINARIAFDLDSVGAFDIPDLLFHADPPTRRHIFAENLPDRVVVKHPNLGNFVNPPLRVVARLLGEGDQASKRWKLSLWVAPLAAGVQTGAILLTLWILGFGLVRSTALALLAAVSFSQLVFGSMPESFALSGAWLGLLLLSAAWNLAKGEDIERSRRWIVLLWVTLGIAGVGITLTNSVPFTIVFFCVERARGLGWRSLIKNSALVAVTSIVLNAIILAGIVGPRFNPQAQKNMPVGISGFVHPHPLRRVVHFPAAVPNALVPPAPVFFIDLDSRIPRSFTFVRGPRDEAGARLFRIAFWGLALLGAVSSFRSKSPLVTVATAAVGIVIFNGVFHAWWGSEYFLYSQHWQACMVVILAGSTRCLPAAKCWPVLLLLGVCLAVASLNLDTIQGLVETWSVETLGAG